MIGSGRVRIAWVAAVSGALAWTSAARATVLNFDDLPAPPTHDQSFVPDTYAGFNFDDSNGNPQWFVETDSDYTGPNSFYQNSYGAASSPNAIGNSGGALLATISRDTPFNFVGADFTSFAGFDSYQLSSSEYVTLQGYLNGSPVTAPVSAHLTPTGYQFVTANFNNIDTLAIEASPSSTADQSFYLLDNLTYTEVPEPGMLWAGALAFLVCRRRRH